MSTLSPTAKFQAFDANGDPLASGKLYTYAAGTTTPLATYTDSGGGTPNANPVILDSRGEANVWLSDAAYKFVLKTSADSTIWTVDNITAPASSATVQSGSVTYIGSISGTNTITGSLTPTLTAYAAGQTFRFTPAATNSGATTLNINGVGAKNVYLNNAACTGGELVISVPAEVVYDGTQFQIVGTGALVTKTTTQTLTNKTLTSPVMTTPTLGVAGATSVDVAGTGNGVRSMFLRGGGIFSVYDSATTEVCRFQGVSGYMLIGLGGVGLDFNSTTVSFSGIGTTASAANAFLNGGSSPANSLLRSTSSLQYKDALQDLTLAEAQKVTFNLHAFSYSSKSDADNPDQRWIGYGAEEIAPIDPRFATFDEKGAPNWVQYERFVVPHGVVLTDHEARIAALEEKIRQLEAK